MIANAKLYNDEKSEVYGDAERMRKLLSNFMLKHNPAYRDPEYVAFPTPIPDDGGADGLSSATPAPRTREASEKPKTTIKLTARTPRERTTPIDARVVTTDGPSANGGADYTGKTFQQAQEHLIEDLIDYTDDE